MKFIKARGFRSKAKRPFWKSRMIFYGPKYLFLILITFRAFLSKVSFQKVRSTRYVPHFSKVLKQCAVHCLFWHHPFKMMNFIKIWASRKDHFTLWTPPLATNLCQVDFFFWTRYVPDYFFCSWLVKRRKFLFGPLRVATREIVMYLDA